MKALIFGGTGFIGRNLSKELILAGYEVCVVTRDPKKISLLVSGVKMVEWDGCSADTLLADGLEDVDLIINLAGESIGNRRWSQSVKEKILKSRIKSTQAIINAIRLNRVNPKILISASAIGYYGPREDEELTENSPAGKDFLSKVCQAWEKEASKAQTFGVRAVFIRIGVVLGTEGALARMKNPFRFYIGGPLGSGSQWMSWIHINDLTKLILFTAENEDINGPVNATAPEPVRMKELCKMLGRVMGKPSWLPST